MGHLMRLFALVKHLTSDQVRCSVVSRDLSSLAKLAWPETTRFYQAPLATLEEKSLHGISNYSELLFASGYHDYVQVESLTTAWADLFDLLEPDLLVVDHAPTALLTANFLGIDSVRIGTGFFAPPKETPYPVFRTWETIDMARVEKVEAWLQSVMDNLSNHAGLERQPLTEWLSPALDLIASWPCLDHYGQRVEPDAVLYIGNEISVSQTGKSIDWKNPSLPKIFAYLKKDYTSIQHVMDLLTSLDANVVVYLAGATEVDIQALTTSRLQVVNALINFNEVLPTADVFICHAGSGSVALSLEHETPVITLPMTAEQYQFGLIVQGLGAGFVLKESELPLQLADCINRALQGPDIKQQVHDLKNKHRRFRQDAIEVASAHILKRFMDAKTINELT